MLSGPLHVSARTRLLASFAVGLLVGVLAGVLGTWQVGLLLGWMAASTAFVVWMWSMMWPMDGDATAAHARREDAGRTTTDVVVVVAAIASLGAVALLLLGGASAAGAARNAHAALSVGAVGLAWWTVHTLFTARYARLYYSPPPGGVDFKEDAPPSYREFAYLAFTIGMTFQVSDTDLTSRELRANALRHALLSYLFGAVIIAMVINLVAGLSH
jgi:uncharacterized membrane protein